MGEYSLIFTWQTAVVYLIVINVIGFLIMGFDKWKAKRGSWRIPEKTLFTITLMGGGVGTIAGMYTFRHKTKKLYFTIGFPVILIAEIILIFDIVKRFL
ncbi:MAG: DUF1294 domain-containing protein [Clostridia bacterium]|nr:DUF1294 domain-containing protein [Clostridia bacterium]